MEHNEVIEVLKRLYEPRIPYGADEEMTVKANKETAKALDTAIEALEKQSEIVHCKECKWWDRDLKCVQDIGDHAGVCMLAKWFCGENGFCLYGKKVE